MTDSTVLDSGSGRIRLSAPAIAALTATVLAAGYLVWRPLSPDLAAQLARADVVRRAGNISWWTGWFGGLSLPTYSVLVPGWMAMFGVAVTGALATLAGTTAAGLLVRDAVRPRAGAVAFAIAGTADLVAGRVTFVVGLSIGVWALVALRGNRRAVGGVLAAGAYLASPLAGLFLGLSFVAVFIADRQRRVPAAVGAAVLLVFGAAMALLFPGTGVMPFRISDALPPAICCVIVAVTCPQRVVRTAALVTLAAMPVFLVMPGAVGANIARFAWVFSVPVVAACATVSRRWLALALLVLAAWPLRDVVAQVSWTPDASTTPAYYEPLARQLTAAQAAAGPSALGERLEVVDTVNHSGSVYLVHSFAIARGWDRQADNANNPVFYRRGALTAASYRSWLHELAVGWVALPSARLDYAARREAALIRTDLPYLHLVWSSSHWRLYRVTDAAPLATGATVTAVAPSSVTLRTDGPATVSLRVRWSSYARAVDPATQQPVPACITNAGGWLRIYVPSAQTFAVTSRFDVAARFRGADGDCASDVGG